MLKLIVRCIFSPRLYKIYHEGSQETQYQPLFLEKWGDKIITTVNTLLNISIYASPFIFLYIYKREYSLDEIKVLGQVFGGISCLVAVAYLLRSIGRASNSKYIPFMNALSTTVPDQKIYLDVIRKYDFEFQAWPVSYKAPSKPSFSWIAQHPFKRCANNDLPVLQRVIIQILAFIATHTFALRLIYPGTLGIIQNLLWSPLFQGRTQLVEKYKGIRAKIATGDGNTLDTMFVDNRCLLTHTGNILVICCEGNSGFYEIGIMTTPIKSGYSALGWNHPGFAESTGLPYPTVEINAIDAVMQYAINELGFEPQNIVLFGWSIGGYPAAWAAANYPEIKALILDATFDDLLPLALNQMPSSWSRIVTEVVRSYVDLNIAELTKKYSGHVKLVRRTEDEVICLRHGELSSNRGNHLLVKLVEARHPELSAEDMLILNNHVNLLETQRAALERTVTDKDIKKCLKLIWLYMHDYKSSHCTPLPEGQFSSIMMLLH